VADADKVMDGVSGVHLMCQEISAGVHSMWSPFVRTFRHRSGFRRPAPHIIHIPEEGQPGARAHSRDQPPTSNEEEDDEDGGRTKMADRARIITNL
jgi:hypothetical protein